MAEIIKVYEQRFPDLVLAGKLYHDGDRDGFGTFSQRWEDWFRNGWFEELERCGAMQPDTGYVGAMRMNGGVFEYWIGLLMPSAVSVPAQFDTVSIRGGGFAVAWIKGRDDPELYSKHEDCLKAFAAAGLSVATDAWYIENYVCPRFTQPDENGEVILDYMVTLA